MLCIAVGLMKVHRHQDVVSSPTARDYLTPVTPLPHTYRLAAVHTDEIKKREDDFQIAVRERVVRELNGDGGKVDKIMRIWGLTDTTYIKKEGEWTEFFAVKSNGKQSTDAMTGRAKGTTEVFKGLWGGEFTRVKGVQVGGLRRVGKVGLLLKFVPWLLLKNGRWEAFMRWIDIEGHTVTNGLERGGAKGRNAIQGSDNYERMLLIQERSKELEVGDGWTRRTKFFNVTELRFQFGLTPLDEDVNARLVVALTVQGGGVGVSGSIGERSAEANKG